MNANSCQSKRVVFNIDKRTTINVLTGYFSRNLRVLPCLDQPYNQARIIKLEISCRATLVLYYSRDRECCEFSKKSSCMLLCMRNIRFVLKAFKIMALYFCWVPLSGTINAFIGG